MSELTTTVVGREGQKLEHLIFELTSLCAWWDSQACIMAVGGTRKRVYLDNGSPVARSHITVTLSADHRVYDGDTASAFLAAFCANIESPVKLLV